MQSVSLPRGTSSRRASLVRDVCDFLRENATSKITLVCLGKRFGVSPYYLQKSFVEVMGVSPRRYQEECRVAVLKLRLARGEPVVGALRGAGYSSHSWLYKDSRAMLGMTPANYKAGGAGRLVMYATGGSRLGRLLVAATTHGVCSVNAGDDDEKLEQALRREFPEAKIVKSQKAAQFLDGVKRHLEGQAVKLPLDIRGTDFQLKVWTAITTIPLGSTYSYSQIAEMIGEPDAVRAVANACGSNPVPLIIPCHRVVRKDGSLGGYGLGVGRKKALLEKERLIADAGC